VDAYWPTLFKPIDMSVKWSRWDKLYIKTLYDPRLKPGMKVATAAFGSGFTWGGAIYLSDGESIEILSGLQEGETLAAGDPNAFSSWQKNEDEARDARMRDRIRSRMLGGRRRR